MDNDNYEIPVHSMDLVFDGEEWSFEFLERHLKRLIPSAKDYA